MSDALNQAHWYGVEVLNHRSNDLKEYLERSGFQYMKEISASGKIYFEVLLTWREAMSLDHWISESL